jgi:hypothetical protein
VVRGPIPKINRRSSDMQAAVTCGCPYQDSLRRADSMASARCCPAAPRLSCGMVPAREARHAKMRKTSLCVWQTVRLPAIRPSALRSWPGPRPQASSTVRPGCGPGTEVTGPTGAPRRSLGRPVRPRVDPDALAWARKIRLSKSISPNWATVRLSVSRWLARRRPGPDRGPGPMAPRNQQGRPHRGRPGLIG